ncbi:MAG: zinc ribbon domain-containing protein, partial [Actinobacteria bacterium]|nr:zinc ribbon domain-containing protein [Actinomycetota bacterium]
MVDTATCRHCNAQNPTTHRFCGFCGSSLTRLCPACGDRRQLGSSWCNNCGVDVSALSIPANSSQSETEERRWVTVVFADLSGFTGLAEGSDPEDVRSIVDRCMCLLGSVVRHFGGSVYQIAGDGMLAVFGVPVAHEDDAERAVRAALKMQQWAEERAVDFGGLSLRIGISTGEVMFAPVGPKQHRKQTVVGDVVNTAARLQTSAPKASILVGEETWRATRFSIRYARMEAFRVKNKSQPVCAWLATGCSLAPTERPISSVPMVDRDAELRLMRSLWQEVLATRRPHLVIVRGPAGIGKSRLCREIGTVVR